jgi:hypothetical protein
MCSRQSIEILAMEMSGVEMGNFGILPVFNTVVKFMIPSSIIFVSSQAFYALSLKTQDHL